MLLDLGSDQDVISLVTSLLATKKADMLAFHDKIKARRDRYFLNHYKKKPEPGEEQTILAHEMRLVDIARSLLTREQPSVHAYRENDTAPGQKESDEVEAWLRGVLYLQRRRQRVDPVSLFALGLLRDSVAVLQSYWDVGLDSRYNAQSQEFDETAELREMPVVIKNRDPLHIFPQEGSTVGRWRWIIAAEQIPILDVEQEWGVVLEGAKGKKYQQKLEQTVEVIDIWSREIDPETGEQIIVNAVMTPKQILKEVTVMDKYRDLPFEIAFCIPTGEEAWDRKGMAITAAMENSVKDLATLRNNTIRQVKLLAQIQPYWRGTGVPPEFSKAFGEQINLREGDEIGWTQPPGMIKDVYAVDQMTEAEIEKGGMGAPLMGSVSKSQSGYALGIKGEAGTLKMIEPRNSMSLALMNTLQNVCSLAANFAPDQEMRVLGESKGERGVFSLTGSQCEGFFIEVDFSIAFPEDKARDRAMGMQLATSPRPILDMRTILESFFHEENVDEIKKRIMVEAAEQHPQVMQLMLMMALQESGLEDWIGMIFPQLAGGGQQQQGSQPSMSMPAPGVGTEIMPQEELGAMRSQEAGIGPGGSLFPEQQAAQMDGMLQPYPVM